MLQMVLVLTLLLLMALTQALRSVGGSMLPASSGSFAMEAPGSQRFQHYYQGCCKTREEAINHFTSAMLQGGLLGGMASTTPSKARNCSTTEALGEQAGGNMFNQILNQILPRSFEAAFPQYVTPASEQEEDEDERKWFRNKVWRCR